jgi:ribosomal protein S18 acetylase RimI-like enzyme
MLTLAQPLRRATADDAPALADLVNFAGEGLPLYLWGKMANANEDPWQIGRRRQAQKAAEGKIFVIDEGDGVMAALTGYAIPPVPEPIPDDLPALFRPLQELENLAPGSWYVNVLAAYPQCRNRGLGTRLLGVAEDITHEAGLAALSIIVAGSNTGARRLYERTGFAEVARRAIVKEGWASASTEWVLLIKHL